MRPWERFITPELEAKEGDYFDFAAWEMWMEEQAEKSTNDLLSICWEGMGTLERIDFYGIMANLADGAPDPCVTTLSSR